MSGELQFTKIKAAKYTWYRKRSMSACCFCVFHNLLPFFCLPIGLFVCKMRIWDDGVGAIKYIIILHIDKIVKLCVACAVKSLNWQKRSTRQAFTLNLYIFDRFFIRITTHSICEMCALYTYVDFNFLASSAIRILNIYRKKNVFTPSSGDSGTFAQKKQQRYWSIEVG